MVSRNKLIIMTVIVFLGLMGPISFFFEPVEDAAGDVDEVPELPSDPGYFVPSTEHSSTALATVDYKEPAIMLTGFADVANVPQIREAVLGLEGVKNVTVKRTENEGDEAMYKLVLNIELNDGSDAARVGYFLPGVISNIMIKEIAQAASITLPPTITTQSAFGEEEISTADASVTAIVFTYAKEGEEYSFQVAARETGAKKTIIALMQGADPGYPTETEEFSIPVSITSINEYGVIAEVPAGETVNVSALEVELAEYNATASFSAETNFITVGNISNSTLFLEQFNDSSAFDLGGSVLIQYSEGVSERIDNALTASGTTGDYLLPISSLQVRSGSHIPVDMVPGTVVSEFSIADVELPETLGDYSLGEFTVLPNRRMPVGADEGMSVNANVTLTIVYGQVDSANAVAESL